jgi:hypothetical protein
MHLHTFRHGALAAGHLGGQRNKHDHGTLRSGAAGPPCGRLTLWGMAGGWPAPAHGTFLGPTGGPCVFGMLGGPWCCAVPCAAFGTAGGPARAFGMLGGPVACGTAGLAHACGIAGGGIVVSACRAAWASTVRSVVNQAQARRNFLVLFTRSAGFESDCARDSKPRFALTG